MIHTAGEQNVIEIPKAGPSTGFQIRFYSHYFSILFHNHSFAFKLSLSLHDFEMKKNIEKSIL